LMGKNAEISRLLTVGIITHVGRIGYSTPSGITARDLPDQRAKT